MNWHKVNEVHTEVIHGDPRGVIRRSCPNASVIAFSDHAYHGSHVITPVSLLAIQRQQSFEVSAANGTYVILAWNAVFQASRAFSPSA